MKRVISGDAHEGWPLSQVSLQPPRLDRNTNFYRIKTKTDSAFSLFLTQNVLRNTIFVI